MNSEKPPERHSVLDVVARLTGEQAPKINLRDSPGPHEGTPVLKAGAAVQGLVPQGRGNYHLQGEIARGGMGVILKAHDDDLGRDVALKVLREDLAKRPEVVQRFVEEAQIGGQLQHPGIVPVYELGLMADQRPYFAMKLVKGRTLAETLLERKAGDRSQLLGHFEAICQTIAYAHSKGVVHRDLKPANVLIGAFGEVQVVDWGLAKVLRRGGVADEQRARDALASRVTIIETVRSAPGSSGSDSLVGSVIGTPAYMPPEQARGDVERLDERSDVFALGAILCEILTGAPPYAGAPEKVLDDAVHARLDDATQRLAKCGADRELIELAGDCLLPSPAARPRSAEAVAERIHGHLASVEERARAAQIHAAEAKVRARATALLSAAGIAIVLLGGGGWIWLDGERRERRAQTAERVNAALAEATLHRGQRRWSEATAAIEQALAVIDAGEVGPELAQGVREQAALVAKERAEADRAAELDQRNRELLALLSKLSTPGVGPADFGPIDDALVDAFSAFDLEIDDLSVEAAVGALEERGIAVPVAAVLDRWATTRLALGKVDDADHLMRIAEQADPDPTRRRLRAAIRSGDHGLLKVFAQQEELGKLPPDSLCILAAGLIRANDRALALTIMRRARTFHPGDFSVHVLLGELLRGNGERIAAATQDEMMQSFTVALAIEPDHARLQAGLGAEYVEPLGDPARGLAMLERAVRLDPRDPWIRRMHGYSLSEVGEFEQALAEFHESARLQPGNSEAVAAVGRGLSSQGELTEAVAALREAARLDPASDDIRHDLIGALLDAGDVDGALAENQVVVRRGSKLIYQYLDAALISAASRDRDGARAALENLVSRTSRSDLGSMAALAFTLADFPDPALRDPVRAVEAARRALELGPRSRFARAALGSALYRSGDWSGCIDALEPSAKSFAGGTPFQWFVLTMAYQQLGRPVKALEYHRDSVEWMEKRHCRNATLLRLRAEAESVLGIGEGGR